MVSGVRRSGVTAESAKNFTTPDLLILKFRREKDFEKIHELVGNESDFLTYILAACAVHLYHHMDVKTLEMRDEGLLSYEAEEKFEKQQKEALLEELKTIIGTNIVQELELFEKKCQLTEKLISSTLELRPVKDPLKRDEIEQQRTKALHQFMLSLIRKYPDYFFFDVLGELFGISSETRIKMINRAAELRPTQMIIEDELMREYEEQFIELGTFKYMRQFFTEKWELKGHIRQLESHGVVFRRIQMELMKKMLDSLPFGENGLIASMDAIKLKLLIINEFKTHLSEPRKFADLQEMISILVLDEISRQALKGPQQFLDFCSKLLDLSFDDLMEFFRKVRITNIPAFCQTLVVPAPLIKQKLNQLNIHDLELSRLSDRGSLSQARQKFEESKSYYSSELVSMNFEDFLTFSKRSTNLEKFAEQIQRHAKVSLPELRDLLEKEKKIKQEILEPYQISNIENISMVISSLPILQDLEKEIFYHMLKSILIHVSRLIEQYEKLRKDKQTFLLALKKIPELDESENWIQVKLEDLIIKKIMARQNEFQDLFRFNDAHLINGFLWARLSNTSFKNASDILTQTPSPIYYGLKNIALEYTNIPPVSFASAYDLAMRLRDSLIKKEAKAVEKEVPKVKPSIEVVEDVETFSWIEKRIKTALMSVKKTSPTDLYWTDDDSKRFGKNLLIHVQVKGSRPICPKCGSMEMNHCSKHPDVSLISPDNVQLMTTFYNFAREKITSTTFEEDQQTVKQFASDVLNERLGHPPKPEEFEKLLEGEIQLIGEKLSENLSQKFNKALYKTYRKAKLGR